MRDRARPRVQDRKHGPSLVRDQVHRRDMFEMEWNEFFLMILGNMADQKSDTLRRIRLVIGVTLLLTVMAAELALSARQQSQTFDEGAHIFAGYRYWKSFDFGANPEHPPLVKLVAAIPLLRMPLRVPSIRDA